jgi:hypothetical protein
VARGVDITITLSRRLRGLSAQQLLGAPLRDFFEGVTRDFRQEARSRAPVDRGSLRRDHVSEVDAGRLPRWGEVRVDNDTAIFVHNGTRPHWAPVGALRGWADRHGINPFALQRSIARKGTRANPWFETAVEQAAPPIVRSHAQRLATDVFRQWGS